jgi:transposase
VGILSADTLQAIGLVSKEDTYGQSSKTQHPAQEVSPPAFTGRSDFPGRSPGGPAPSSSLELDRKATATLATMRRTKDADLRRRYQMVWLWTEGFTKRDIAQMLCCHRNTVAKVLRAFPDQGELGLVDGRVGNGLTKVTPTFVNRVEQLVDGSPDPRWNHTTWTEELLTLVMAEETGIQVSVSTLCRVLKRLKARKGRPRPGVRCPWPAWKRQRRLRELRKLIETLPPDEIALFEDEVDIHLNPKIGPDWMLPGTQKEVVTPGQNQKRYIAGVIRAWGKDLLWVSGPSKRSALFIQLVEKLCAQFPSYQLLHLIVDNYIIHTSQITQKGIAAKKGKVQCHFLPPYCPQHNPIERLWRDLHASVTRNHRSKTIDQLMTHVADFLDNVWTDCQEDSPMPA